jgi:hypothetical protein
VTPAQHLAKTLVAACALTLSIGCQSTERSNRPERTMVDALEAELGRLSLKELDQAALVFRVAFDKSLESWQGPEDLIVAGCSIPGPIAENGLVEVRPWLERRASEEAKRVVEAPKTYQLPIDEGNCAQSCSCGLGLRILEAANLEGQPHSRVKDLKRLRSTLESRAELVSSERAEFCTESMTWICSSELLKLLRQKK